jgi:hypothetical protein
MTSYSSTSGKKSGVIAYEIGDTHIIVRFSSHDYQYSYNSCGQNATETMKKLALASNGLSTFIAQNKPEYEWKKPVY